MNLADVAIAHEAFFKRLLCPDSWRYVIEPDNPCYIKLANTGHSKLRGRLTSAATNPDRDLTMLATVERPVESTRRHLSEIGYLSNASRARKRSR
jgi:hypothetical protein